MYSQVLEYRKFVQTFRDAKQRRSKLLALASKIKTDDPVMKRVEAILEAYRRGDDILDPDLFDREDIIAFAEKHGIQNDPQVVAFIEMAKPR